MSLGNKMGNSTISQTLAEIFSADVNEESFVKKTYGEGEDNFTEGINEKLKNSFSKKVSPKKKIKFIKRSSDYPTAFSVVQYKNIMSRGHRRKANSFSANAYADVFAEFPKFQVTITNSSPTEKEIVLWGANREISVSAPSPEDVQDHVVFATPVSLPTGVYPQAVLFNPVNNFIYVANQLSGTVSVIDSTNRLVTEIQLQPVEVGRCSPVALAVNTKPGSLQRGFVYVACSVSGEVSVIDLSLNLFSRIPIGGRPIAIAYNSFNNSIYVANLIDNTLAILDGDTNAVLASSPLPVGNAPIGLGINPVNGDIYVANIDDNTLSVVNSLNAVIATVNGLDNGPVSITYNPVNATMYVVCTNSNSVYEINTSNYTVIGSTPVGIEPYNSFYDPANGFVYVQNRGDNTITVINSDNTVVATLNLDTQNVGGAYNNANGFIYVSDTTNNRVNVIGYLPISSSISVNPDYYETNSDFQSNPCIIQHTRFIVTGAERINNFRHNRFQPTGSTKSNFISFEQFASPQHGMNVAEAIALAGTLIDGKMNWRFKLPGLHTVSILIWFRQFLVEDLLRTENKKQTF